MILEYRVRTGVASPDRVEVWGCGGGGEVIWGGDGGVEGDE